MTGIADGRVALDGGAVEVQGVKALLRDAEAVGIAATDLKDLTHRLAAGIRPSRSKRKVMVRVGSKTRLPYAGVRHWGPDSRSGPRWLSRAEEALRPRTFAAFGEGIKELLDKHNW